MNNENTHPQEPQVKSAEEIKNHLEKICDWFDAGCHVDDEAQIMIIEAQEALKTASQFKSEPTEELKEKDREIAELKAKNESQAMRIGMQSVVEDESDNLQSQLSEAIKEIERLKSEPKAWTPPTNKDIEMKAASYGNVDYPIQYGYLGSSNDFNNGALWMRDQYLNSQRKEDIEKLCAMADDRRCKTQCYTCSEDEKNDFEWTNKTSDIYDLEDMKDAYEAGKSKYKTFEEWINNRNTW